MIKIIKSFDKYLEFIKAFLIDKDFKDPMLTTNEQIEVNLFKSLNKENNIVIGVFNQAEKIKGVFVFLIEKDEKYMQMLVGLSKDEFAYKELFEYLYKYYNGFKIDFVYNPNNHLIHEQLKKLNAIFEKEQVKLKLQDNVLYSTSLDVEALTEKYYDQYIKIHNTEMYWTGEKITSAPDRFKTLIAIKGEQVVGYIDFTYIFKENEPYDLFVLPEYRGMKYGKALLARAIEINKPNDMMVLLDYDNTKAINLYKSLGFHSIVGENNITAHLIIK